MKIFIVMLLSLPLVIGCGDFTLNPYDSDSTLRIPSISLLTPATPEETCLNSFTVEIRFGAVVVDDKWSLYYVSDSTPSKGRAILTNFPVTARSIVWDTTDMPSGHYYLYAELTSLDSVVATTAPGSIVVDHSGEDNSLPTVKLLYPKGGESLSPGETVNVTFQGSDPDGDTLSYAIEVSNDYGLSWNEIASSLTESSYSWAISESIASSPSYLMRVKAIDSEGASWVSVSESFSVQ